MRVPGGLLSLVPLFALVAVSQPLAAQCPNPAPEPAISVETIGPDYGGWVTIRGHYDFGNLPAGVTKKVTLGVASDPNNNHVAYPSFFPTANAGVYELRRHYGCWPPGEYEIFGVAEACNKTKSDTALYVVAESPTPSVDLSYDLTPDANGLGRLIVSYEFPLEDRMPASTYRTIHVRRVIPGVSGGGTTYPIADQQGTLEIPWSLSCLGTATFSATARSCDLIDVAETTFTQLSKPNVSISAGLPDANGNVTFTIPYTFPNTGARRLQLVVDGTTISTVTNLAPSGTWAPTYPNACWKKAEVFATACNQNGNPDYTDHAETPAGEREPKITELTLRRNGMLGGEAKYEVRFGYEVLPGTEPWTAHLELLPYTDIAGIHHPALDVLPVTTLDDPAGTMVIDFTSAETRQLTVRAKLTSCTGVVTQPVQLICDPCEASFDPVYYSDGNMLLHDGDPLPPIAGHSLSRSYNSHEQAVGLFGRGWTTLFDRRLTLHTATTGDMVALTTESNETILFRRSGNAFVQTWPTGRSGAGTLTHDPVSGVYSYRAPGSSQLALFRASDGRLIALRHAGTGQQADIAYDAAGRPATLSDSWTGLTWTLTVDAQRRVMSIAVAGLTWTYEYDAGNNLATVNAPGNATWRTYEYTANRMTASRDGLGNLIESHSYDTNGAAISSVGPGDEIASIAYGQPAGRPDETITVVTQNSGAQTSYRLRAIGGAWRTVEIANGCSNCGSREATLARDPDGRVIRRQNADGYVTVTAYSGANVASVQAHLKPANCDPQTDPNHCRLGSDALAATELVSTAATITTNYSYADANWPEKATTIGTASVLDPQSVRQQTFTYDAASGALLATTTTGLTGTPAAAASRTTQTALYDGVATPAFDPGGTFQSAWMSLPQPPRLGKSQDGPRADVQDVTSYVHY
ncbi:MAG TPA: DUF6531 domain-containing protein, partial [Thermoanaerobaculia bacterium]|nr:DUF6531 domain-containing protein [Thermoanaerobaculia bacterium]